MDFSFTRGGGAFYSSDFDAEVSIANITNAQEAVMTTTADANFALGDLVLLSIPGWEHATDSVFKVKAKTGGTSFTLQGLNSTDVRQYPTGGAKGGTARKIKSWTVIPQVTDFSSSGGDPKFVTVDLVFMNRDISIPDGFNPTTLSITCAYDVGNDTVFKSISEVSRLMQPVAIRVDCNVRLTIYAYGYLTMNDFPTVSKGTPISYMVGFSVLGTSTTITNSGA